MTERLAQIEALSRAMASMPGMDPNTSRTAVAAPARRLWATELIDRFGVSIDPNAAVVEAVSTNPASMGNLGPQEVRERTPEATMADYLRDRGPGFLAANSPDLAARIAAAKTQGQRDLLLEELKTKILADPNDLLAAVAKLVKDT